MLILGYIDNATPLNLVNIQTFINVIYCEVTFNYKFNLNVLAK